MREIPTPGATVVINPGRDIDLGILSVIRAAFDRADGRVRELVLNFVELDAGSRVDVDALIAIDAYYGTRPDVTVIAHLFDDRPLDRVCARCPHIVWTRARRDSDDGVRH